MTSSLPGAILQTLQYSDYFNFPLTKRELLTRLIRVKTTEAELSVALDKLVRDRQIMQKGSYYALPGRASTFSQRQSKAKISASKLSLAQGYAHSLAHFPGILGIYLTGSLAVHNSTADDDIDFMIITQGGWLWRTRLLLTLYCELKGIRRKPRVTSSNNLLCLNLYLSENALVLPQSKRSLYTAYELIQAKPLYDPTNTRGELLRANSWLTTFLPNYVLPLLKVPAHKHVNSANPLENLAFRLQQAYMQKHKTTEYVTRDAAFFHPHFPGPPTSVVK